MDFSQAIKAGFSNYVNFEDRASRSEYWYWVLFVFIVGVVATIIDSILFSGSQLSPVNSLWSLAVLIPGIAISVRRLHDIDRTGWWVLLALTLIGALVLLYWDCVKGTDGPNRFGPDPLAKGF
jgi:uncharacterized membrane protein YhaH (DUF805 family)